MNRETPFRTYKKGNRVSGTYAIGYFCHPACQDEAGEGWRNSSCFSLEGTPLMMRFFGRLPLEETSERQAFSSFCRTHKKNKKREGDMRKIIFFILGLGLFLGCAKVPKKVLLVFSYHPEYSWVVEQTKGVEEILMDKVFDQEDKTIILHSKYKIEKFYLDTKRKTSLEWKTEISEKAVEKINEFKPDIVIVFDDNDCELVAKQYIGKKLPFVFCGMNGEPSDYGFPAENITGVIERLHINESYQLLKQILPDVEKIAFITDNSHTSNKIVSRINKTDFPAEISEIYTTNNLDEWKTKIKDFQKNVDAIGIILYHTIQEDGKRIPSEEVIDWTLENNQLPEFVFWDFVIADGAFCGVTISGYEQGKAAAEIAKRILNGEKPSDIQISRTDVVIPMINTERAKQLKLKINTLSSEAFLPNFSQVKRFGRLR